MVLLSRLEYRLKTTIWEDKKYKEIFKPIMKASELQKKDKEFIIKKAATLSIYGALQLLNHDASNTISWQQICNINKRQARDGSLTNRFNTNLNDFTKHMGTGWVIINDKNE
ncbi:hypothetical protein RhiirA5_386007, partial [Rhizophagus irregularis]